MPSEPTSSTAKSDKEMPPGERLPADEEIHARLARHGFLVSDDVDDPEGADDLASTMLSVIESMLATGPANEPPVGAAGGDDSAGPLLSRPSTSS